MRGAPVDRVLLRTLFIVVGVTTGITGAQAAILLLRDQGIWDASPAASAVATVGSACAFSVLWLILGGIATRSEAPALSPARRLVLVIALLLSFAVAGAILAVMRADHEPFEQRFVWLLALALMAQPAAAVILVETMRAVFPRMSEWSAARHFAAVAIVWLLLALVQSSAFWRAWPRPGPS